jgi:uncharacterized protein (TIGR00369 family)
MLAGIVTTARKPGSVLLKDGVLMSSDEIGNRQRIRTIVWEDPRISARDAQSISGLDYLRAIKKGEISPPPVAQLLGYNISEIDTGLAVFELEPAEYHYNPFGTVHGGIASTLLDTTMTAAVLSTLPPGVYCSTIEIKVNFILPIVSRTGTVLCRAKTIHVGNRIATAEGKVVDRKEKLYAHAVSTFMIFKQ